MKTILAKCIAVTVILGSILAACTGPSSQQFIPTETAVPTISPTSTITPTPVPLLLGKYELLSPEDMRHDLDELFFQIEKVHPNPYTKRPKSDVDLERQRIYNELDKPMTMIDFYRKVDPFVSSLGDRHTYTILPKEDIEIFQENELLLPLDIGFDGQKARITASYSNIPELQVGAQVLSINGIAVNDIDAFKASFPGFSFWLEYGSFPEYQVEVLRDGETTSAILNIPGMTWDQIQQKSTSPKLNEAVTYRKIPNEAVGVLTIREFIGIGPLLKPAFAKIKEENVQHLIIDVRMNPGGSGPDISSLMDYLTDQPYRLCSRSYKAPFGGYGTGTPREADCELIQPFDTEERFHGNVYLLIGPHSFSAPIIFGNILQDYGMAALIGEQTRDAASFCAMPSISELPRTRLGYEISTECFVRPSGILDDQPLTPDIPVETTVQDQLAGKDPVLDYTLEMIRNNGQHP